MSRGVIITDRDRLGLAIVLVRKGKSAALEQHMRDHFRIELPQGPHRTTAGELALIGMGPGAWLVAHEQASNALAQSLRKTIGDLASVSDQSDAYVVLRLSGPGVREALTKLVPIDVHARAFKVGDVAATVAAHIGATLWRLEDDADGSAVFEIAVYRSFATSFWRVLRTSSAFEDGSYSHSARSAN